MGTDYGGSNYGYGPSENMSEQSLVNDSRNYDWGVYNPIANGGNQAGQWRTLTKDEWDYLISGRPSASSLRRGCTVNGVKGLLLLPDGWSAPVGFVFNADNVYEGDDWTALEASGCVFLPAAGYHNGYSTVYYSGELGDYWSSTGVPYSYEARRMEFNTSPILPEYGNYRYYGRSVRLVKDL